MEEVGGGWRRLKEVGGGWRRLEEVGGGWRRLEEVGGGWRRLGNFEEESDEGWKMRTIVSKSCQLELFFQSNNARYNSAALKVNGD